MKLTRRTLLKSLFASLATLSLPSWAAMRRGGGTLTAVEKSDLVFMREEEKLARDVYTVLGEKWGNAIFFNIASSEQRHMDAILNLLNKYGVPDPAAGKAVGEFVNVELQQLFNDLIAMGSESALNALKVGGIIEETDVEDIVAAIARTNKTDIRNVYTNLLNGSYNHLQAFAGQIEALTGVPYVAQVISQEEVDTILGR
jgi:hypothetical protein